MASNPSEVGGHGLEIDPNGSSIETLTENKPETGVIGVLGSNAVERSREDEPRDQNQGGDVDQGKEREMDSVVDGQNVKKDDPFFDEETNMNTETDGDLGDQRFKLEEKKKNVRVGRKKHLENDQRVRYHFSLRGEKPGFSVDELVWGKVRSHPWWPGQIFDPKYASDMALKCQKKDHFLVSYFGDKSFAWVPASQLKPFQLRFSELVKQSSIEPFVDAVDDALEEVSRRVELGMACNCLADETCADLKHMEVENAGIREGTCCSDVDQSVFANAFRPECVLEYVCMLAQCPLEGFDRLDLVIATAQLKAFYHSKGYPELPLFVFGGGLVDSDAEIQLSKGKVSGLAEADGSTTVASSMKSGKRSGGRPPKKQVLEDDHKQKGQSKLKEGKYVQYLASPAVAPSSIKSGKKSRGRPRKNYTSEDSSEQMEDEDVDYHSRASGGKRKVIDSKSAHVGRSKKGRVNKDVESDYDAPSPTLSRSLRKGRVGKDEDSDYEAPSSNRSRSLMVGDRISRIAGQLRESPTISRKRAEATEKHETSAQDYSSPSEMLAQLCLVAIDPMHEYSFLPRTVGFFTKFRAYLSSVPSKDQDLDKSMGRKRGRKKKVDYHEPDYSEMSPTISRKRVDLSSNAAEKDETSAQDYSSPSEMLEQLCLFAIDPMHEYGFLPMTVGFFTKFRDYLSSMMPKDQDLDKSMGRKRGRKKEVDYHEPDSSEMSEPDYMQDSYWADIILHSSPEREPESRGRKRKGASKKGQKKILPDLAAPMDPLFDAEHIQLVGASSPNEMLEMKGECIGNTEEKPKAEEQKAEEAEEQKAEEPTMLILNFNESDAVPSADELNKIFSPYGPLREEETELLRKTNRAKVVFRNRHDAEKAFSSAGKYSVFGPALVSYRLKYSPSPKSSPAASPQDENYASHAKDELQAQAGTEADADNI